MAEELKKVGRLDDALTRIKNTTEALETRYVELEKRLESVCLSAPPQTTSESPKAAVACPTVTYANGINERLGEIVGQVEQLLDRLEV